MKEQLQEKIGLEVKEQVPLNKYTTFKIGGPAKFFVEVKNKADLHKAVQAAVELDLDFFLLGGGSNILVADDGFNGLVIRLINGAYDIKGTSVRAFAGTSWPLIVIQTVKAGLTGFEPMANIPGTVGGAVRGNAGAFGVSAGDYVKELEVLEVKDHEVSLKNMSQTDCQYKYRGSVFQQNNKLIITEAVFELKKTDEDVESRVKKITEEKQVRCAKQPLKYPSAGCSFTNIEYTDEYSQYKDWVIKGKVPVARFIDACDLKGQKIGGAMVAKEHANFIINVDNATADHVVQLISLVKMKVRDQFGVQLQEEIEYVGF